MANSTTSLQLGKAEKLKGKRHFLNTDRPQHYSIDHLKERGVEKPSWECFVFNQTNIGTLSRARWRGARDCWDRAECLGTLTSTVMPTWLEIETEMPHLYLLLDFIVSQPAWYKTAVMQILSQQQDHYCSSWRNEAHRHALCLHSECPSLGQHDPSYFPLQVASPQHGVCYSQLGIMFLWHLS